MKNFNQQKALLTLLIGVLTAIPFLGNSQNPDPPDNPTIKALKVSYITTEVGLTSEEAEEFWPVYWEFDKALKAAKKEGRPGKRPAQMTEDELNAYFDRHFASQEKELKLKKQYHARFIEILGTKKTFELYRAEIGFKKKMLEEMRKRRGRR